MGVVIGDDPPEMEGAVRMEVDLLKSLAAAECEINKMGAPVKNDRPVSPMQMANVSDTEERPAAKRARSMTTQANAVATEVVGKEGTTAGEKILSGGIAGVDDVMVPFCAHSCMVSPEGCVWLGSSTCSPHRVPLSRCTLLEPHGGGAQARQ